MCSSDLVVHHETIEIATEVNDARHKLEQSYRAMSANWNKKFNDMPAEDVLELLDKDLLDSELLDPPPETWKEMMKLPTHIKVV